MRALLILALLSAIVHGGHADVAAPSQAPIVCNDEKLQQISSTLNALKTTSEAQSASLTTTIQKLVESSQAAAKVSSSGSATAAAAVDLSPVIAAVEAVRVKVTALTSAGVESDASEAAAIKGVTDGVAAAKVALKNVESTIGSISGEVKAAVSKSSEASSSRLEALEKEVLSLKQLVQQLVDSKSKKEDNGQLVQLLDNQNELLKLYKQHSAPVDWKALASNATQTAGKYLKAAFDFSAQKATAGWIWVVEYVKYVVANPPDFQHWQAEALKLQGEVVKFAESKGVPKDKSALSANITLGFGAVASLLVTLSIVVKVLRFICCCGRSNSKGPRGPGAARGAVGVPATEERLKEEADTANKSSSPSSSSSSSSAAAGSGPSRRKK